MKNIYHGDVVAIRKSGIEGWEPYKWQRAGEDSIVTGGVPRILKSGPRKGKRTWDGKGTSVVVTRAEVDAEASRYVAETGNCARCYGDAQVFQSWDHIEGTTYKPCPDCNATGRAKEAA